MNSPLEPLPTSFESCKATGSLRHQRHIRSQPRELTLSEKETERGSVGYEVAACQVSKVRRRVGEGRAFVRKGSGEGWMDREGSRCRDPQPSMQSYAHACVNVNL